MAYEIRALSFGEILDTGFRLVRDHWRVLLGISALAYAPLILLFPLTEADAMPSDPTTFALIFGVLGLAMLLLFPILSAAIAFAVGELYLGRVIGVMGATRKVLALFGPLFGTWLLAGLIWLGVIAVLIPLGAMGSAIDVPPPLIALVLLAWLVAIIYVGLRLMLLTQVMVMERRFGVDAILRSHELIRGHAFRAIGIWVVASLIGGVLGTSQLLVAWVPVLGTLVWGFFQILTFSFTAALTIVLYFDIRCRKEAFDLEHLSQLVAGESAAPLGGA